MNHPDTSPLSTGRTPAREIRVDAYRQILIWPVLLRESASAAPLADRVDALTREPGSKWENRPLTAAYATRRANVQMPYGGKREELVHDPTFEEIVYFHPFVRDFLYGDGRTERGTRSLFRLTRSDIQAVQMTTSAGRAYQFDVDRVELYLAKPNVAILVMEVGLRIGDEPKIHLDDALRIQAELRHVFPPYFRPRDDRNPAAGDWGGNCPRSMAWLDADGKILATDNFHDDIGQAYHARRGFAEFTALGGEPPVAAHWKYLLHPLVPMRKYDDLDAVQQIIDERIPGMTYLSVQDPRAVIEGDLDRLAFCEPSEPQPYPYSPEFFARQRANHTYTRFWRHDASFDCIQDGAAGKTFDTLLLCSACQFVAIGNASNTFFTNIKFHHFRQHYFRIGLLLHFHRAALLKFLDDLAESVKLLRDAPSDQELLNTAYVDKSRQVLKSFLKFRSRCWFEEVSNQMQGAEIYDWWSEQMGVDRLFKEVETLADSVHRVLMTERNTDNAGKGLQIAIVALIVSIISLIVTLFTTNPSPTTKTRPATERVKVSPVPLATPAGETR
jgi:hypothetical protein